VSIYISDILGLKSSEKEKLDNVLHIGIKFL